MTKLKLSCQRGARVPLKRLQYLTNFKQSIGFTMTKSMQHCFVFVSMANITLARRDTFLDQPRSRIRKHTLASFRNAQLHLTTLFCDSVIRKAEVEISQYKRD